MSARVCACVCTYVFVGVCVYWKWKFLTFSKLFLCIISLVFYFKHIDNSIPLYFRVGMVNRILFYIGDRKKGEEWMEAEAKPRFQSFIFHILLLINWLSVDLYIIINGKDGVLNFWL